MKNFLLNCLPVLISLLVIFLMGTFIAQSALETPAGEWIMPRVTGISIISQCVGVPLGVSMLIWAVRDSQYSEPKGSTNPYAGLAFAMVLLISDLGYLIMLFVFNFSTDSKLHAAHLMISISVGLGTWLVWMMILGSVGMMIAKGRKNIQ